MAEKYDNNGSYNSAEIKRDSGAENGPGNHQDGEDGSKVNEKAGEYMRELLSEKIKLNNAKFPLSIKLIDTEVTRVQATGRTPGKDNKYLDVFKKKPTKVTVKVLVPIKEHPKFNFVGKLLGPKGNTMKQLQEETMCKMAVFGRGSMRDRQKEEELRNSLDPKYSHLTDELHVEIAAIAPPAEAHARIAYALAEVKKYLIPDPSGQEMMWQPPMERGGRHGGPPGRPPPRAPPRMPPAAHPAAGRGMPAKTKVISILDRARSAMESSYSYDDPYGVPEQPMRGPPRAPESEFYYDRAPERFYEDEPYYKEEQGREFKGGASARDVGTRRPPAASMQRHAYARPAPYQRLPNQRPPRAAKTSTNTGGGWN